MGRSAVTSTGNSQRHARVRNVHVRNFHRTCSGQNRERRGTRGAGPTSVPSRSSNRGNTPTPAPVPIVFFWRIWEPSARQKGSVRTEAIVPIILSFTLDSASGVRCPARYEALLTTALLPSKVADEYRRTLFFDVDQQLEHIVMDDRDGETIASEQCPWAWCDLHLPQPRHGAALRVVPQVYTFDPDTVVLGHAAHSEPCVLLH